MFTYLGNNISSIENDIYVCQVKTLNSIDRLSVIRKSDLYDKIEQDFFEAVAVSIILYGCTTWMLTKKARWELYKNAARCLEQIFNQ